MAGMTEEQGEKIIDLLKSILEELERMAASIGNIERDVNSLDTRK